MVEITSKVAWSSLKDVMDPYTFSGTSMLSAM
jgi:hypothetical protein